MAEHALIDAYLADLHRTMRWHRGATDIVAEADDHLRSAVERLLELGRDPEEAQREALERFGDPAVVARAYAFVRPGRLAAPTRSTKGAGVLSVLSGGLWLAFPVVWFLGGWLYDRLGPENSGDELGSPAQVAVMMLIGCTLLGAAGSLVATLTCLHERHGGFGVPGVLGIAVCGLGAAAALLGWFFVGWGSALVVGTVLVAVDMWRRDVAPRRWVLAIGGGPAVGAAVWGVLRGARIGNPDQFGEYQIANIAGLAIGPAILAVGLIGLGRWLASEDPVDFGDPIQGADRVAGLAIPSPSS